MRHKDLEITDQAQLTAAVNKAQVLHLAMSQGDEPYSLPLTFGYTDGRIYIHSSRKGKKAETLRANPRVAFSMVADMALVAGDTACKFSCDYTSVAGTGTARFLETDQDKLRGLAAIMAHYADRDYPVDPHILAKTEVIEIEITHITGQRKQRK